MSQNLDLMWILKSLNLGHRYDEISCREGTIIDNDRLISVDLSDVGLTSIPKDAFKECEDLCLLNLSINRIGSIEKDSFKGLKSLEILELQGNRLQNLPSDLFSKENSVSTVNLSGNHLNSVPKSLKICKHLKSLNLANNQIHSISQSELGEFHNLEYLDLHGNKLEDNMFKLILPTRLKVLNISEMDIESIEPRSFLNLESLEELNISSNNLETLPKDIFHALKNLKILWIANNKLKELNEEINQCLNLTHLIISSNNLIRLPDFRNLKNIRYLVAMENQLKFFNFDILNQTKLEEIWLSGNPELGEFSVNLIGRENVQQFYEKQKNQIELLNQIQVLLEGLGVDVSSKEILERERTQIEHGIIYGLDLSSLGIVEFKIPDKVKSIIANVKTLNLSDNFIEEITPDLLILIPDLKVLDLQNNPLQKLPKNFGEYAKNLSKLFLKGTYLPSCWRRNFVDEFDIGEFAEYFEGNWEILQLLIGTLIDAGLEPYRIISDEGTIIRSGKINALKIEGQMLDTAEKLKIERFSFLKRLVLKRTALKEFCAKLPPLEFIDLSDNNLKQIDISSKSLKIFILNNNSIGEVRLEAPNLRILELQGNKIKRMNFKMFNCPNLEEIDLSFNQVKTLDHFGSISLRILNLMGNPISRVEDGFNRDLPKLEVLNLENTCLHPSQAKLIEGRQMIIDLFS